MGDAIDYAPKKYGPIATNMLTIYLQHISHLFFGQGTKGCIQTTQTVEINTVQVKEHTTATSQICAYYYDRGDSP